MSTVRKALAAGLAAALSAVLASLVAEVPRTQAGWALLAGGAVSAFIVAAFAVYETRNAPAAVVRPPAARSY